MTNILHVTLRQMREVFPHWEQGKRNQINTKHSGMTRDLGENRQEPVGENQSRNCEARTARL